MVTPSFGPVKIGSMFESLEEAHNAVFEAEERNGHKWVIGQTYHKHHRMTKQTLRCNRQGNHNLTHDQTIDPSDHRQGKSMKTGCTVHVNILCDGPGLFCVSLVDFTHNHDHSIPSGGVAARPPTSSQQEFISKLSTVSDSHFTWGQVASSMKIQTVDDKP